MGIVGAIQQLRELLAGKKTYLAAALFGALAGLTWLGVKIPTFVWPLLSAAGLGSMRAAINGIGDKN
ncbi:MAG: hypothetical protein ACLFVS_03165 [Candidatus Acetothermia bacterium]